MRGYTWRAAAALAFGLAALFVAATGCRTTTRSGLPEHIRTVEVHLFRNTTMYKGVEAQVTRRIIDRINGDPRIRMVTNGGDAILDGEIVKIARYTLRETTTNEPGTVRFVITARYSLYDEESRRYIIEDAVVSSDATGMSTGLMETNRPGDLLQESRSAAEAVADEIVRRTVGMW